MVGRQVIFDMVTDIMQALSGGSKVNLTKPDFLISINVLKKTALLACIQNYFQRHKFSIRVPDNPTLTKESDDLLKIKEKKETADTESSVLDGKERQNFLLLDESNKNFF